MTINHPSQDQIPALRALWQQAFGDDDRFLDCFFATAFSSDRCLCIPAEDKIAAALYWLDCSCRGERLAYLYAVATDLSCRGKGLCHSLMSKAHELLQKQGYAGAVLVPGSKDLFRFYENMGYLPFGGINRFTAYSQTPAADLRKVGVEEYATLRKAYLPEGGVLQEDSTLAFLQTQAAFYAGDNFLFVAAENGDDLIVPEFLGNRNLCGNILSALGKTTGHFRGPGQEKFAMYLPLSSTQPPSYFGLALD